MNRDFDPKDLVCPDCSNKNAIGCPKHGKDFLAYKCKFCCNYASWFCWGNTHFCEPCHEKQCKGEYVSKLPRN